jgi:hypothetical protein
MKYRYADNKYMHFMTANSYEKLCGDLLAVHQRRCTLGKMESFSRLNSDEITNLWIKLCNLYRI